MDRKPLSAKVLEYEPRRRRSAGWMRCEIYRLAKGLGLELDVDYPVWNVKMRRKIRAPIVLLNPERTKILAVCVVRDTPKVMIKESGYRLKYTTIGTQVLVVRGIDRIEPCVKKLQAIAAAFSGDDPDKELIDWFELV